MAEINRPTEDAAIRRLEQKERLQQQLDAARPLEDWDYRLLRAEITDPIGAIEALAKRLHVAPTYIAYRLNLISVSLRLQEMR